MNDTPGPLWMGVGLLTALAAAATAAFGLKLIATPTDFDKRRLALESQTRRIEALAQAPGNEAAYPKGAVCEGAEGQGPERLREALQAAAAAQSLRRVQVALGEGGPAGAKLAPLAIRLEAEGGYAGIVNWMDEARRLTPTIFVDAADLNGVGPEVRLVMTGRVFCWARG